MKSSRMPRYHQIAHDLRERIAAGDPGPGEQLDPQRGLAREFGVTLMTLRQALGLLERDGLIVRRHGLGTFVASAPVDYDILHLQTLAGDLSAKGAHVSTRFLRAHFTLADRWAAEELELCRGARAFVLERLRLVGGRPMSFQASYLPASVGEEVTKIDLALVPLRQALLFKLGIEITAARETVAAVRLESRAARELGCRLGIPAFRSDRVSVGPGGRPVVYDRVYIPGDRFRITRQLQYSGRSPDASDDALASTTHRSPDREPSHADR